MLLFTFKTKRPNRNFSWSPYETFIDSFPIKKEQNSKFLGFVLDDKLSWESHVTALTRKPNYASATLCRIRDSVPIELHTDLYHTLFEYLRGVAHLSITSKKFGQLTILHMGSFRWYKAYLDRFETCSRARPYPIQVLGQEFFQLEHSKPLFKNHKILALEN